MQIFAIDLELKCSNRPLTGSQIQWNVLKLKIIFCSAYRGNLINCPENRATSIR